MDKSPEAFRTISEVADSLELPQHVLRFWESKFSQLRPLKRGGGRRYYRPEDINLLEGIRHLLYDQGYTIRGVQKILKEQGAKHVSSISSLDDEHVKPASVPEPVIEERLEPIIETVSKKEQARIEDIVPADHIDEPNPASMTSDKSTLEKDDIKKLQDTLYELSEIRRLLKETKDS